MRFVTRIGPWLGVALAGLIATPALAGDPPEWSEPIKPFRVIGNISYVGTRGIAAYLITSPQGAILLDGGLPGNAALVERNIAALGVPLARVRVLLINHAHADHAGALARLRRDSGARLLASAGDRWALEHGTPRGDTDYGVLRFPPVRVDGVVRDGATIRVGGVAMTALLTPGHTPGCTSWRMTVREHGVRRRVLFLCSVTVAGNLLVGNRGYPGVVTDFRATFARLARERADVVLTGHPEAADVLGRAARRDAGEADAFVDPALLPRIVARANADFEAGLAKARAAGR